MSKQIFQWAWKPFRNLTNFKANSSRKLWVCTLMSLHRGFESLRQAHLMLGVLHLIREQHSPLWYTEQKTFFLQILSRNQRDKSNKEITSWRLYLHSRTIRTKLWNCSAVSTRVSPVVEGPFTLSVNVCVFCNIYKWVQCCPVMLFIHCIKKIKRTADKNKDVDAQCERTCTWNRYCGLKFWKLWYKYNISTRCLVSLWNGCWFFCYCRVWIALSSVLP